MIFGWSQYPAFALGAVALWAAGALLALRRRDRSGAAVALYGAGILLYALFIALLWVSLGRPPMRTLGETRLFYSLFLSATGLLLYLRRRLRLLPALAALLASVFALLNALRPEIHDATLPPALQSGWFVPHVAVYMLSYAVMGCALLTALWSLARRRRELFAAADSLARVGTALLLAGMLTGAVWAQQAWGHYWSWDPKESWAALTWLLCLLYLHLRAAAPQRRGWAALVLVVLFLSLQITWWGIDYLPAAQQSLHIYSRT